jgi:hypothetical protein
MPSALKTDVGVQALTSVFPVRISDLVTAAYQIVILCLGK